MHGIGILGGTFDPVHHGHLRLALELYERLGLAEVRLVPSARPPHRQQPSASAEQRLAMLRAAVGKTPGLRVEDRELRRPGPSYMFDTLSEIRAEAGRVPLCLLLGMDAFMGLPGWHRWRELIELAHLVVVRRPNTVSPLEPTMREFLTTYQARHEDELRGGEAGRILIHEIPALTVSATEIRTMLATGRNPRYLLPDAVLAVIEREQLYRGHFDKQ
jgi:nicotinate-nucleotide adenylyltransferase